MNGNDRRNIAPGGLVPPVRKIQTSDNRQTCNLRFQRDKPAGDCVHTGHMSAGEPLYTAHNLRPAFSLRV